MFLLSGLRFTSLGLPKGDPYFFHYDKLISSLFKEKCVYNAPLMK